MGTTSRERFVRVLTGKDADRVPFIKLFGGTGAIVDVWARDYPGAADYIDELIGFEGTWRGWNCTPVNMMYCKIPEPVVLSETETETVTRYGDGSVGVSISRDGHHFGHSLKFAVEGWEDWENMKGKWLNPHDPARFPKDWANYVKLYNNRDYALQLTCGGVYGFIRRIFGDEALCYLFYDDPELVNDVMDTYIDMCIEIWKKMVVDVEFDIIECWEDMAYKSGPMLSQTHFNEFMAPQYNKIRDFAGNAGIPIRLVDSDGNIMELSKWMDAAGINCMYPFEVQAGNDIEVMRSTLPEMACIGGLDKECMARGKNAMDEELEKVRKFIPLGRLIPGPDHFVLENVPFENYEYFMKRLKQIIIETGF